MALENLEPVTREEALLDQIAVGESELTGGPVTRHEWFMTAIAAAKAGSPVNEDALDPVTREEYFLKKIAESFTGGGVEMESGKYDPASDVVHPTITFTNSHDRSPDFYFIVDTKTDAETTPPASTNLWMVYVCWENFMEHPVYEGTNPVYGFYNGVYWYSGSATNQLRRFNHTTSEEPVGADSVYYPQYFATPSEIKPYVADTRKFKSTQSYDWYAFWL